MFEVMFIHHVVVVEQVLVACRIKAVPEMRAAGTFAYYMSGTLDGARPGIFYVNIHNLSNW